MSRIFFKQLVIGVKLYSRTPSDLLWMICFPIALLVCLGALFGGNPDAPVKLTWLRTAPASSTDEQFQRALGERGLKVEILAASEAEARWRSGKLPALLEGENGRYRLRVDTYFNAQGKGIEASVQQSYLIAQARMQGAAEPSRIPVMVESPAGHHDDRYVAYLLPGLLGFNLLTMGVFNTGLADVAMRARGGYKRLATTPVPRHIYLAAQLCVRLIVVIVAATLLMLTGVLFFGIHNRGDYLSLAVLVVLGAACFISMGYLLASFARTVGSYDGVANTVFLPMTLLSGVYFSIDAAPSWVQHGADVLPLAALLRALRAVFNDGASLASQGPVIAAVAVWTGALFLLAVKRFRWV